MELKYIPPKEWVVESFFDTLYRKMYTNISYSSDAQFDIDNAYNEYKYAPADKLRHLEDEYIDLSGNPYEFVASELVIWRVVEPQLPMKLEISAEISFQSA